MSAPLARGYSLAQMARYLETEFDPVTRDRLRAGLSPELRALLPNLKPTEWYSRAFFTELLRAIASVKNDDVGSYQDLLACGQAIATEATGTFLKLVMKMLTPTLFAKKLPDLWRRDHSAGTLETDVSQLDSRLIVRMGDVEGFDHIGPVSAGWVKFALENMNKRGVKVQMKGWSMATPGPAELELVMTWT